MKSIYGVRERAGKAVVKKRYSGTPMEAKPEDFIPLYAQHLKITHQKCGDLEMNPHLQTLPVFWVGKGVHKIARHLFASERHKNVNILIKRFLLSAAQSFNINKLVLKLFCTDSFGNNQGTLAHINLWIILQAEKMCFRLILIPCVLLITLWMCPSGSTSTVLKHLIHLKWGYQQ